MTTKDVCARIKEKLFNVCLLIRSREDFFRVNSKIRSDAENAAYVFLGE